jgi:hypothetical protein
MTAPELTPISTATGDQIRCHSSKDAGYGERWRCTREEGHELPHEAAGPQGTVYTRWVDWSTDKFSNGEPVAPVIIPTPSRPARIAALHMAGLFLAEHTDLPMPEQVTMSVWEVPLPRLQALAQAYGTHIVEHGSSQWIEITVGLETLHGVSIRYVAFAVRS